MTDPFLTVTNWFLELCTRDSTIFHFKNTIFGSTDPWQPHFSPWQVYIISTTPVTDPFLTVISWVLELCTRDRPISHFKNTIFCSPDPWKPHFLPWQVYNISTTTATTPFLTVTSWFWRSVHVTDPFLTSKIPYFVAQIRDNPISHRDKSILLAQHPWQTHFAPWQVGFWSSVHATEPFLTSKIPYFVAQIRDNPISHCDKYISLMHNTRDRPISYRDKLVIWSSVHTTDPFLTSKIPYFEAQIRDNPIYRRDKSILLAQHPWQTPFLTKTSWVLELCTRDRTISNFKSTIFCSPNPWKPHFSPWQV